VSVPVKPSDTRLLNTAITNSFNTVSRNIPVNSKIAIVNIASDNNVDSNFILEELTLAFVNAKRFTIVDRQTLNIIREELNFQLSGEVSDETVVSIGKFTGADVVITGTVSGNGEMRRLRLRALDVETAQILAMSAEKI
jgi:TolB-like protein